MWDFVRKPLVDQSAATAIEYGLLLGVIAMSMFFGMTAFTDQLINVWQGIADHSPSAPK